jgi:general secretion pathway protein I
LFRSTAPETIERIEGFTLIEVLISLVVISISLAALGSLMASNRRVANSIDAHLSLVETARGIETALPDRAALLGNSSGESGDYRWGVGVRPFVSNLVDPQLPTRWIPQAVTIRVRSPEGLSIDVDTVRLRPRPTQ